MNGAQSENYGLASLITQIAMTYLSNYYDICVIWQRGSFEHTINSILMYSRSSNNDTQQTGSLLPPYRLYKFNDNETERQEMMVAAVNFGCRVFLISTDSALNFSTAYINAMNFFVQRNPNNRFIFIPSDDTKRSTVDMVLNLPISYHIPDLLVITPCAENGIATNNSNDLITKYDIITTKYIGRHNNTAPITLDQFSVLENHFENGSVNLFSNKIANLNGRLLKLTLLNYKPYTLWRETAPGLGNANILDSDEENNIFIDGTEVRLFLAFCELYNCTIAVWAAGEDDWGGTFSNGTGTGLLGAIVERSVDVGVSALFSDWYEEYVNLDQSIGIQRASMAIIAPRPILKPEWQLPALPFSLYLWYAVVASFVVSVIGLVTTDYFIDVSEVTEIPSDRVNVNHIVFEVTSLLFGQSVERILTSTSAMVIYGCILLISMIIDSAYTGGLSSFMAVPRYEDPIDTVHQLAAKGWRWGGAMDAWVYSILLAQQVDVRRLLDLFTIFSYEQLSNHLKTGDYSYAIERLQYGHFSIPKYITLESIDYLRLMRDDIYYDYTTAMCYKTWPYKRMLNPMIRQVVESGLMRQWELQVALKYLDNHLQLAVTNSRFSHNDNTGPIALATSHLLGAFLLLLFGHVIAFIMLIGEISFAHHRQKKQRTTKHERS